MAQAFVDTAQEIGFDAVKFQTHLADSEGTASERFRLPSFPQDSTRQEYWCRTAFTRKEWLSLAEYTRKQGLVFLSSPFSEEAVDLLLECNVPAWKVASGEVSNLPMLEKLVDTELPVILSSGLSGWSEIDRAISALRVSNLPVALMQCNSAYPCPPEGWGLNLIREMQDRYHCPVGISDHSGKLAPSLAAITLGANLVEVHLTLSKQMFGPDVSSSLTPCECKQLVKEVRALETALATPVDKDATAFEKAELRQLFTKSIVAAEDLSPGTVIERKHLAFKKPGDGISAADYRAILGCRIKVAVQRNEQLKHDLLEKNDHPS